MYEDILDDEVKNIAVNIEKSSKVKVENSNEFTDVKDGHGEKEAGVVVPSTVRRWADHIYVSLPRWKVG